MRKLLFFLTLLLASTLVSSCGESRDEKVARAIIEANQYLSTRSCDPAIKVLEDVGRQHENGLYLLTLSSAYACRSGYSEITFFADDIDKLASSSRVFEGLASFSTSPDFDNSTPEVFEDLNEAIDILLFAGGQSRSVGPSFVTRRDKIGEKRVGDLHAAALYMTFVQMGRFFNYYGSADASGVKQHCLFNYSGNELEAYFQTSPDTGSCTEDGDTDAFLGEPGDYQNEHACRGIVLFNNLFELLPLVINAYSGGELDDAEDFLEDIEDVHDLLDDPNFEDAAILLDIKSTQECLNHDDIEEDYIQYYYALIFEALF